MLGKNFAGRWNILNHRNNITWFFGVKKNTRHFRCFSYYNGNGDLEVVSQKSSNLFQIMISTEQKRSYSCKFYTM